MFSHLLESHDCRIQSWRQLILQVIHFACHSNKAFCWLVMTPAFGHNQVGLNFDYILTTETATVFSSWQFSWIVLVPIRNRGIWAAQHPDLAHRVRNWSWLQDRALQERSCSWAVAELLTWVLHAILLLGLSLWLLGRVTRLLVLLIHLT